MPTEFRLLPSIPYTFREYDVIPGSEIGRYLQEGWCLIASVQHDIPKVNSVFSMTMFLVGRGEKKKKRSKAPPLEGCPEIGFPQETVE